MNIEFYPMSNIVAPGEHDVLCGRGGHTIHWSGNIKFRALVEKHRERYHAASRVEKGKVVAEVVQLWRMMTPPGRFLTLTDPKIGDASPWQDIGDKAAQKKTAKRLRESLPETTGGRPASATFSTTTSSISSDDESKGNTMKRVARRVSNDSMEKAAKRLRMEIKNDLEFQQVPSLSLLLEDQFSNVSDNFEQEAWEKSNGILADYEELDLDSLFDEAPDDLEPIATSSIEEVNIMGKFHESWLSTSTPSAMSSVGDFGFGRSSSLLREIGFSIPSAACLTATILFD